MPIESTFKNAAPEATVAVARNLLNISSIFLTGSVSRVSKVPLSFSPAVTSIAGYMAPISTLAISKNGMIYPNRLPTVSSWVDRSLNVYFTESSILSGSSPAADTFFTLTYSPYSFSISDIMEAAVFDWLSEE